MSESTPYRPDVDGLRALAVAAVVAYHYFPTVAPGGFVGVDIFFVISGYLISTIVLSERDVGGFQASRFYIRRGLRLFPALAAVLVLSFALGWSCLLTDEFEDFGKHLWNAVTFTTNIAFWKEAGYFDVASVLKPLLHLWSLSVEEQFYLVWPMLLGAFAQKNSRWPVAALFAVTLSFVLNIIWASYDPAGDFFLPHTRLWELGVGGLLASAHLTARNHQLPIGWAARLNNRAQPHLPIIATIAGLAGLVLISCSFCFITDAVAFPGVAALLPVTGSLLIIAAGQNAWTNRVVFSTPLMTFIGLISYPLYLWHWPLLSYFRIMNGSTGSIAQRLFLIAAAFTLSVLTYWFIEKPLRFGRAKGRNLSLLVVAMLGLACLGRAAQTGWIHPRSSAFGLERIIRAAGEWTFPAGYQVEPFHNVPVYIAGDVTGPVVLYAGDSNMQMYSSRILRLQLDDKGHGPAVAFLTSGGCPPIPGLQQESHPYCRQYLADVLAYASRPQVKTVVIAAQWYGYFASPLYRIASNGNAVQLTSDAGRSIAQANLTALFTQLNAMGKTTYLVLGIPIGQEVDPKGMVNRSLLGLGFSVNTQGLGKAAFLAENQNAAVRQLLKDVAQDGHAIAIDPLDFLCGPTICPSVDTTGEPMYKDANHLRPSYVERRVTYLDQTLALRQPAPPAPRALPLLNN